MNLFAHAQVKVLAFIMFRIQSKVRPVTLWYFEATGSTRQRKWQIVGRRDQW